MIRLFRISHPIRSHGNELDLYHLLWRLPECWNSHPASGPLSDLWHLRHEALYMPQRNRTRFTRYDVWIVFKRICINTCCLGTHPVWAGRKDGYMILQDVPSDGISLAACKTCHNGLKITGYIYQIAVGLNSRAIEAVGSTCFTDSHNRRVIFTNTCVGRSMPFSFSCLSASSTRVPYPCMIQDGISS